MILGARPLRRARRASAPADRAEQRPDGHVDGRRAGPASLAPVLVPVTVAGAAAVAAAVVAFGASGPSLETLVGVLLFALAAGIAEAYPVPIEGVAAGRTSLATVFIVAVAEIHGWAPATLVAAASMGLVEAGRRRPLSRIAFNTALYGLAGAAAGGAAALLPGPGLTRLALGTLLGSAAFYAVNISLLALIVARSTGQRLLAVLRRFVLRTLIPFWIMASLTIILVVLWDNSPFLAFVLAGPLLTIAFYERRIHGALNRLRELDRLKDEFIAVVSHELRTPLASVYGAAMTLERPELDESGREALLGIVYRESARLARLVDQVLWASRLESGATETAIERVDAPEVAREVVEAARAHATSAHRVELTVDAELPPVAADGEKLMQVLVNLVENAVKYSPDGGLVEVRLEPAGDYVRFTVTDEGLGIPVSEHRRIFEKFHRLDPNMTRGVSGTGLGLYICNELVRRMDGRIWVTSVEGEGSRFAFELPRAGTL